MFDNTSFSLVSKPEFSSPPIIVPWFRGCYTPVNQDRNGKWDHLKMYFLHKMGDVHFPLAISVLPKMVGFSDKIPSFQCFRLHCRSKNRYCLPLHRLSLGPWPGPRWMGVRAYGLQTRVTWMTSLNWMTLGMLILA